MTFTAMTYNIRSGRNMAGEQNIAYAAQVIGELAPDVVNLNEVRARSADVGPVNQAEMLGELLGMNWRFGKSIPFMGGAYGNAMLSRFPVLSSGVEHIPDPQKTDARFEHRTVFKNVLDVRGTELTLLGTHFGLSLQEQENAVQTVLRLAREVSGPVLFMGDLNAQPDQAVLQPLFEVFTDCFDRAMEPKTYPASGPEIRIDYVMARGLTFKNALAIDSLNSDHLPILCTVEC